MPSKFLWGPFLYQFFMTATLYNTPWCEAYKTITSSPLAEVISTQDKSNIFTGERSDGFQLPWL
jgi:hypothetical protein